MRILVLTDRRTHNPTNSFYGLVRGFARDSRVEQVAICDRANPSNNSFYSAQSVHVNAFTVSTQGGYEEFQHLWMSPTTTYDINAFDAVLLRLPRPVSDDFFLFLENSFHDPRKIVNRPSGIVAVSNKAFLENLPQLCPPLALVQSCEDILDMQARHGDLVIKPLREHGGRGIVRLRGQTVSDLEISMDVKVWCAAREAEGAFPMLAVKFLRGVVQGDKRVLVVHGRVIGAALRMPRPGSWVCNVAQGGTAMEAEADEDEMAIANELSLSLRKYGVVLFGFDTLVGDDGKRVLSEINALSPGGIWPAEAQTGKPLTAQTASLILDYLEEL